MFANKFENKKQQKQAQNFYKHRNRKQVLPNNIENSMKFLKVTQNIDFIQRMNKDEKCRKGKGELSEQKSLKLKQKPSHKSNIFERLEDLAGTLEKVKIQFEKKEERSKRVNQNLEKIRENYSNSQKQKEEKFQQEDNDPFFKEEKQSSQTEREQKEQEDFVSKNQKEDLCNFVTQVSDLQGQKIGFNIYGSSQAIYYVSEVLKEYKVKNSLVRQHIKSSILFLSKIPNTKIPHKNQVNQRKVDLPVKPGYQDKITLVFDLDQTLIHCNQSPKKDSQIKLPVKFPTGETIQAGINVRPGAIELLEKLSSKFEIIVFTASHPCYANVVIDHLDPQRKHIHHRLFREHCYQPSSGDPYYVKDLRIINRKLKKMVLIDNAAYSYAYQIENGVPVLPYYEGKDDFQLQGLEHYLMKLLDCEDVRVKNRETFKLMYYVEYKPQQIEELVYNLYQ